MIALPQHQQRRSAGLQVSVGFKIDEHIKSVRALFSRIIVYIRAVAVINQQFALGPGITPIPLAFRKKKYFAISVSDTFFLTGLPQIQIPSDYYIRYNFPLADDFFIVLKRNLYILVHNLNFRFRHKITS